MSDREKVLNQFKRIASVPHPSGYTALLSKVIKSHLEKKNFQAEIDDYGNLRAVIPASKGCEDAPAVILQGHLDMVAESESGYPFDFEHEPIQLIIEGDKLTADRTTLGADDGLGVSIMLALTDEEDLEHPEIQLLMTVDEETTMGGAEAVDASWLDAPYMINLDSEEEGIFTLGSAGGARIEGFYPVERVEKEGEIVEITVTGVTGGHSGVEINRFGANANLVLAELLDGRSFYLDSFEGGKRDNVIPKESHAKVLVQDAKTFIEELKDKAEQLTSVFSYTDPDMTFVFSMEGNGKRAVLDEVETEGMITALRYVPNGVIRMEDGAVVQSANLGAVQSNKDSIKLISSVRGNSPEFLDMMIDRVSSYYYSTGAIEEVSDYFPAWPYKRDSELVQILKGVYEKMYGEEPKVDVIHAGLESSFFSEKNPDLDIVSIGPTILNVHTPDEEADLQSAESVYGFIKEVLRTIAGHAEPENEIEIYTTSGERLSAEDALLSRKEGAPDCTQCEDPCE